MNSTGLSIIKTLGCMTAVTFFTIYNTWDALLRVKLLSGYC